MSNDREILDEIKRLASGLTGRGTSLLIDRTSAGDEFGGAVRCADVFVKCVYKRAGDNDMLVRERYEMTIVEIAPKGPGQPASEALFQWVNNPARLAEMERRHLALLAQDRAERDAERSGALDTNNDEARAAFEAEGYEK